MARFCKAGFVFGWAPMPYVRLSGFYFFYFALLGTLVPYWALWLQSQGHEAVVIGWLMGMLHVSRILAPNLWGWLADRTGRRMRIIRLGALAAWLIFILIHWQHSVPGIALVMLGFSFFWNAVLPQFEVITLEYLGREQARYSRIRLWGSVGFVCAVVLIGQLLDRTGIVVLPWVVLMLLWLIWLNTLLLPAPAAETGMRLPAHSRLGPILRQPQVIAFFAVCFLVQFSHGPYYTFYSVMLQEQGYTRGAIGLLWALGVMAEIVLFVVMPRLLEAFSLRGIMLVSLLLCVLRWGLTGLWPDQLHVMLFAQLLHAATFGSLHAVGIALVQHYFDAATRGRGQALFSSLGFGAGGAVGAVLAGQLWAPLGQNVFLLAAGAAVVAIVLTLIWIYPEKAQQNAL